MDARDPDAPSALPPDLPAGEELRADPAQAAALLHEKMDPALLGVGSGYLLEFMTRVGSSSKRLMGPDGRPLLRWQDDLILAMIPEDATVLDLGCGGGELLARLMGEKGVRGQGVELDPEAVFACVERGVPVFQTDLDGGLRGFPERNFDYVVLEETLQTLHQPHVILDELLRVARSGIVSFPNFGYWRVRMDLAVRGRMPVSEWLPFRWFDSPNIHLFTLQDFLDWCREKGVAVVEGHVLAEGQIRELREGDNLYAEEVLLRVEKRAG